MVMAKRTGVFVEEERQVAGMLSVRLDFPDNLPTPRTGEYLQLTNPDTEGFKSYVVTNVVWREAQGEEDGSFHVYILVSRAVLDWNPV